MTDRVLPDLPPADLAGTGIAGPDPLALYLATLAPSSQRTVIRSLKAIARLLGVPYQAVPWRALRYPHVVAIRAQLLDRDLAPATINVALAALRGIAREAWKLQLLSAEELARITSVKGARGTRLPAGRSVSRGELAALLAACAADQTPAGIRDGALIAVLYAGGLRRAELAGLTIGDWTAETAELRIRHGKGKKQRRIYLVVGAAQALADWIGVRGTWPGPLFVAINKGGRLGRQQLTAQAVYNVLQKRAQAAGITELSPHDLRRTFVGDLLDAGADIATVQQLAGHANVQTTARYDRRGEAAKRKAIDLLHVPYTQRHR
ncbi:MAG TPA: tyrosine-type recombinase/integrase [Herpetosiphonaceae bacterium]